MLELLRWVVCVLDRIILYDYLNSVLDRRKNLSKIFILCFLLISGSIIFFTNLWGNSTWNLMCGELILLFTLLLLFHEKIKTIGIYFFIITVVQMLSEFSVAILYYIFVKGNTGGIISEPWAEAICLMVRYMAYIFIGKNKKQNKEERKHLFWLKIMYPAVTILILLRIYQFVRFVNENLYGIEWICILLMIVNIISFRVLDDMADIIRKNERYQSALNELSLNVDRYKELEAEERAWKEREHDLTKYLAAIGGLAKEKKEDEILGILEGMQLKIEEIGKEKYIEDGVINALLKVKISEAQQKGIQFDFYAEPNLGFEDFELNDLIAIIGNQLENAIEAAELCEKKRNIWVRYYSTEEKKVVFEIENSCEEASKKKGDKIYVNGEKLTHHGLGTQIIQETVNRYGGIFDVGRKENVYRSVVVLPKRQIA